MKLNRLAGAALLAFLLASANAQEAPDPRTIAWKAVDGASGYVVEIRNSGQETVFTKTTAKPTITFTLPPGDYEARITVLNKFRKPASVSPWTPVSVRRSVTPSLVGTGAEPLYAGARDQSLTVRGSGFLPFTEVILEGGGRTVRAANIAQDQERILASFDLTELGAGDYVLRLKNPPSTFSEAEVPVKLLERAAPAIASVSKSDFTNDRVHRGIRVSGSGFRPGLDAEFVSPSGRAVKAGSVSVESASSLSLSWNSGDLETGQWKLRVTNPGGLSAEGSTSLVLRAPSSGDTPIGPAVVGERIVERIVEVPVERIVERIVEVPVEKIVERIVEVPVEKIVERIVEVPVEKGAEGTTERIVEVPVEKIVERIVEVPVEKIVERIVEVPVEKIVERIVEVPSMGTTERIVEVPVEKIVEKIVEVPVEKVVETSGPERIVIRDIPFTVTEDRTVIVPKGGTGGVTVLAGYPFIVGFGDYDEVFKQAFIGASIAAQADIGNGVLHLLPVFNLLALELGAVYFESPGREALIVPYLRSLQFDVSIIVRSRFRIPLQISGRLGGGTMLGWITKTSPFTTEPARDFSTDFFLNLGLSAFWEFKSGFVLEGTAEMVPLFYALSVFPTLRFGLRAGWRFNG